LNGPIIPIYGLAAESLYLLFFNSFAIGDTRSHTLFSVIVIYACGTAAATLLEYVTSVLMEKLFHAKWWDYSDYKYNFQGRICLIASLFWGFLSVLMAEFIQPFMNRLIGMIMRPLGEYIAYGLFGIFILDFAFTVAATVSFDRMVSYFEKLREQFYENATNSKWSEIKQEFREKYENSRISDYVEIVKGGLGTISQKGINIKDTVVQKGSEIKEIFTGEIGSGVKIEESKIKDFFDKYKLPKLDWIKSHIILRLVKAFPKMKLKNREGAFGDLKDKLKH
jgi:uncharacterized membrane protein